MSKKEKEKAIIVSFSTDKKAIKNLDALSKSTNLSRSAVLTRLINKGSAANILQP